MKKSYLMIAISMTLVQGCYTAPPYQPSSHVSGYPGVSIGISYSTYPDLVRIPGYPVYYAPGVNSNYFFYDGLYWVFQGDNWYASGWYNGPWDRVGYYDVPVYVLRVPVRYYRQPPPYFRGWRADAPPRWGDHWGRDWEQRRSGWDRWDRGSAPAPAPLPTYQRNYSGDRYPRAIEQQRTIRSENYRYQPREPVTQQYFKPRVQQDQRFQDQRQQDQRQQEQRQQDQRFQDQRQQEQRQQDQRQQEQRQQDQRQQDQRQQDQRQQDQRESEKQQVERKRQAEQQQEQRQRDVRQKQQQAVEKQPAERNKRPAQTQQAPGRVRAPGNRATSGPEAVPERGSAAGAPAIGTGTKTAREWPSLAGWQPRTIGGRPRFLGP
ncbi:hypothetical protein [Thiobacillus sp.]